MKIKLISFLLILLASSSYAQIEGDWYGSASRNTRSASLVVLHISKAASGYVAKVDFPEEKKSNLEPQDVVITSTHAYLLLPDQQLAIEGTLNAKSELTGNVFYGGKPSPITFTKTRIEPVVKAQPAGGQWQRGGQASEFADKSMSPDPDTKRVIPKSNSLFIEELTWLDIRDNLREGKNTVIITTGGVEQSGPYIPTGKHNYILRVVTQAVAQKLGNALIAPIVPFVPEGNTEPPSGHVKYAGTISLREETYENLLRDILTSYKAEGFKTIVLFGDSGGNQWGMFRVAKDLDNKWKQAGVRVIFVSEYYDNTRLSAWLKTQGIEEGNEGIHDNFKVTAQIMVLDPSLVRADQRIGAGKFSINGVNLAPIQKTVEMGKKIVDYQSDIVVESVKLQIRTPN